MLDSESSDQLDTELFDDDVRTLAFDLSNHCNAYFYNSNLPEIFRPSVIYYAIVVLINKLALAMEGNDHYFNVEYIINSIVDINKTQSKSFIGFYGRIKKDF